MDEKKLTALAAELAKGLKTEADLSQFSHMLTTLTVETALNAELADHLGHEKNAPKTSSNSHNGYSLKTVLYDGGEIVLNMLRDRENTFELQLIKEHQTRITRWTVRFIPLCQRHDMTTREIIATFKEMYNADVSPMLILKITAAVKELVKGASKNGVHDKKLAIDTLSLTIKKIKEASPDSRIIFIGPVPEWNANLVKIISNYLSEFKKTPPLYMTYGLNSEISEWDSYFSNNVPKMGIEYISAYKALCNESGCLTRVGNGPDFITAVDWGHLTKPGSDFLFNKIGNKIIK